MEGSKEKLRIAMFPWLAYGHLMPFFEVAKFLAQKGHRIYFVSTPKNIRRIPNLPTNLSSNITLVELPLPHVHRLPQGAESTAEMPIRKVPYLKKAYDQLELPLTQFLQKSKVNWIIHDIISHWLPRVATQLGVNSAFFSIYCATSLAFIGPASKLINGRGPRLEDLTVVPEWIDFPCKVAYKLHEITSHQECEDTDVPDFYRVGMVLDGCRVVIVRSCPEFEPDSLRLLGEIHRKPVVPAGLLPPSVQDVVGENREIDQKWELLKEWLDGKGEKSVFYVAFGSEVTLSREMMHELAYGIEKSGLPFIWVVKNRPLVEEEVDPDIIPPGFETRVSGLGLIWTGWAPQLKILAHSSVGGFLTHCGWSSVIEALGFGRALILLAGASSDLGLVARLLDGKRVGLEIERDERDGSFTSDSVAKSIRRVMVEEEGEPLRANAWAMREIFSNPKLHYKYMDELTQLLEKFTN